MIYALFKFYLVWYINVLYLYMTYFVKYLRKMSFFIFLGARSHWWCPGLTYSGSVIWTICVATIENSLDICEASTLAAINLSLSRKSYLILNSFHIFYVQKAATSGYYKMYFQKKILAIIDNFQTKRKIRWYALFNDKLYIHIKLKEK